MNTLFKPSIFFSFLILLTINLQAQKGPYSSTLSLGMGKPILADGIGYHIGFNPAYKLTPIFSLEGQVSYIRSQINGSFLSGEEGVGNTLNLLAGGRFYLLGEERNTRPYINLLLGGHYEQLILDDVEQSGWALGISLGGYVAIQQFVVGLSFDSPQVLLLKLGYTF